METSSRNANARGRWLAAGIQFGAFVALWATAILLLLFSGGFQGEFGHHPDEAAHYVTGLMIHDYVTVGNQQEPRAFAESFYVHYPKVAFGVWPPLFHVMEAIWMLFASPSRISVLVMLTCITALLAYSLFRAVEERFGFLAAIAAGIFLTSAPLMQQSTSTVMIDSSVALFSFLAVLRFGRYLDAGRWQDSAWFGIWSSAAMLTKYNGLALVLLPPLCILFTRRWDLLRQRSMWLSAVIVLVLCGPWYFPMWNLVAYAAEPLPGKGTVLPAMVSNFASLTAMIGLPAFLIAAAGAMFLVSRQGTPKLGLWISAGAFILGCWIFHSVACPYPTARYMLPALPAMILFLPEGTIGIASLARCKPFYVALGAGAVYAAAYFHVVPKQHFGYSEVAQAITSRPDLAHAVVLTAGSPTSEGMSVSEIAMKDHRPGHYVLRGSKLLATDTWMGARYRLLYRDTSDVLKALAKAGVTIVILEINTTDSQPHNKLLAQALLLAPETWQRWNETAWSRNDRFVVYKRVHPIRGPFRVEIPMESTLRNSLVFRIPAFD
jgi:hypothetical protein